MKQILVLTFIVVALNQCVLAQIKGNTVLIAGTTSMAYAEASSKGASAEAANIAIKTGFFVAKNFALGASLAFSYTGFSAPTQQTTFTRSTVYGVFGRYYVSSFIIGVGYGTAIISNYGNNGGSGKSEQIPIEIGFAGFITDNITLEPIFTYIIGEEVNTMVYGLGFGLYFNRQIEK